jgi:hypothetical protein
MFDPNKLKKIVFSAMILAATVYTGFALWNYWSYIRLDAETPIESVTWSIQTNHEESHQLKADYTFRYQGKEYRGETVFPKPVFINRLGAEYALKEFSDQYHQVMLALSNPTISSLQKQFPLKQLVSTAILWAIIVYFSVFAFHEKTP